MPNVFDALVEKAKGSQNRIVLTETEDKRILSAANKSAEMNLCKVILLGDVNVNQFSAVAQKNITVINIDNGTQKDEQYSSMLYELRKEKGMTLDEAKKQIKNKLIYAMMMLKCGDADGVVSGAVNHTADVLRPAFQIVKMKEGINKVSSLFIMESPNANFGENGFLIFADCGVNPNPTDEDLAEIAIVTSETAKRVCGINPRIAMLTYSSKSGDEMKDENVLKVKRAVEIVKAKRPDLEIDGELQADAALVPEVAKAKAPNSILKGKANILIFPDLNSGNIAYKLVQRLAGVKAVGPILQGLNAPVNDLSRGTTDDEIVLAMAITILQSK